MHVTDRMIDKPTSPIIRQTNNLTQAMENQIESDIELRDSLNRDLRVNNRGLFYLINPYFNPEIGISKHIFLRSVQLDENVRMIATAEGFRAAKTLPLRSKVGHQRR